MDAPPIMHPPAPPDPPPAEPPLPPLRYAGSARDGGGGGAGLKKALVPVGAVLLLLLKFGAKLKFLILPVLKFFPLLLKTGGSMIVTIGLYALAWGWRFALGFVLLLLVHECGHLLVARRLGLRVGAPVFIPFMGAFIALKEAPRNAWIEAQVGLGGPLLGTLGAVLCEGVYWATGNPLFRALAYVGFLLNLFNLAPVGPLDGGRIVTALSPWLWVIGIGVIGFMMVQSVLAGHANFLLFLVFLVSLPRLVFLFRRKTDDERRYFEVTPTQRWIMAGLYFGLIAFLVAGMGFTFLPMQRG